MPVATFEYKRKPEPQPPPVVEPKPSSDGDVLQIFESGLSRSSPSQGSVMTERARGVAEEMDDLLAPEVLQAEVPPLPQVPAAPASVPPPAQVKKPAAEAATQPVQALASVESPSASADAAAQQQSLLPFDLPGPQSELQLELLADPPQERKRAVGDLA